MECEWEAIWLEIAFIKWSGHLVCINHNVDEFWSFFVCLLFFGTAICRTQKN